MTSFKEIVNMSPEGQVKEIKKNPKEVLRETSGVGLSAEALKELIDKFKPEKVFSDDMFRNRNLFEILDKGGKQFASVIENVENYFLSKNIDIREEIKKSDDALRRYCPYSNLN